MNTTEIVAELQQIDADYFNGDIDEAEHKARRTAAWARADDADAVSAAMMGASLETPETMQCAKDHTDPRPPATQNVTQAARMVAEIGRRFEEARSAYADSLSQDDADVLALWAQSLLDVQRRTRITWETEDRIILAAREAYIESSRCS